MKNGIIDLCKQIEDPSMNRKRVHKMETSIYISIAAVICGAQSWNEIEEFGNSKMTFFKSPIPSPSKNEGTGPFFAANASARPSRIQFTTISGINNPNVA